jgi:hypothetical protein
MDTNGYVKNAKNVEFNCEKCCFITCNKYDFKKHLRTSKHLKNIQMIQNDNQPTCKAYSCICGKKYKYCQGLSKHKIGCMQLNKKEIPDNFILDIVQQNKNFKDLIIEQNKQIILQYEENQKLQKKLIEIISEEKIINNTTNNNTNNKFNLNFFLNEQCKDALNIMDFVSSLKIQLSDLENVGKIGYTEGISKIFIKGLQELDIFKRPVHCSDLKREILYVKDKDLWEKEKESNDILKIAIKHIAHKNIKQLPIWIKENPASNDYETKQHSAYIQIVSESMGASTEEGDDDNYNKIIKNVAKEVIIQPIFKKVVQNNK